MSLAPSLHAVDVSAASLHDVIAFLSTSFFQADSNSLSALTTAAVVDLIIRSSLGSSISTGLRSLNVFFARALHSAVAEFTRAGSF